MARRLDEREGNLDRSFVYHLTLAAKTRLEHEYALGLVALCGMARAAVLLSQSCAIILGLRVALIRQLHLPCLASALQRV